MKYYFHTFFKTIPKLGLTLSSGKFLDSLSLVLLLWWFVLSRKFFKKLPDVPMRFSYLGKLFTMYLRYPMDIGVLREIYIDDEYVWCPVTLPKVIVDLGAHYGDTALYYHLRFPEATIIAVEPSPENFARLVQNTNKIPNIIPVQAAVGKSDGVIDLYLGESSLGHSTQRPEINNKTVSVPLLTLKTLLKNHGFVSADLVKFDIEGAEFAAFSVIDPQSLSTSYIGEVHTDLVPGSSVLSFINFFVGMDCTSEVIAGKGRFLVKIKSF